MQEDGNDGKECVDSMKSDHDEIESFRFRFDKLLPFVVRMG